MRNLTRHIHLRLTLFLPLLLSPHVCRPQTVNDWKGDSTGIITTVDGNELRGGEYDAQDIINDWNDILRQFEAYRDDGSLAADLDRSRAGSASREVTDRNDSRLILPSIVDENGIDLFLLTEDGINIYMALDAPAYFQDVDEEVVRWVRFYAWKQRRWTARIFARYTLIERDAKRVFAAYGVPEELTELCLIESGCNPSALSHAGALGLWQIMPETGRRHGLTVEAWRDDRLYPTLATPAAASILRANYRLTGDWTLAAAAYNCGPGRLKKTGTGVKEWKSVRATLPKETRNYIPSLLAMRYVWVYRKELGF